MPRSLTIRKPKAAQIRQIHNLLEDKTDFCQRRRAEAVLLYATGMNAVDIAQALDAHFNTIYADLHALRGCILPNRLAENKEPRIKAVCECEPTLITWET